MITGPSIEEDGVRRTTQATAGCHSNVHRLPRAVGVSTSDTGLGVVSNTVSVLFRPCISYITGRKIGKWGVDCGMRYGCEL